MITTLTNVFVLCLFILIMEADIYSVICSSFFLNAVLVMVVMLTILPRRKCVNVSLFYFSDATRQLM